MLTLRCAMGIVIISNKTFKLIFSICFIQLRKHKHREPRWPRKCSRSDWGESAPTETRKQWNQSNKMLICDYFIVRMLRGQRRKHPKPTQAGTWAVNGDERVLSHMFLEMRADSGKGDWIWDKNNDKQQKHLVFSHDSCSIVKIQPTTSS